MKSGDTGDMENTCNVEPSDVDSRLPDAVPGSEEKFVCLESLVTAVMDMYPSTFRRKYGRELLILAVAVVTYLLGLIMVTERLVLLTTPSTDLRKTKIKQEKRPSIVAADDDILHQNSLPTNDGYLPVDSNESQC
ncbi:hypothetical protein fugu_011627 [Takifugu bimaculatus]|uniref:Uncharacterized protein n=1 Tax=Takifugu bimaculatus TaxID=433685 RepID=A0A4Z2C8D8_9TELE|nr:hypothetical protein fugu_011627 [Takifugu bimaculatus]